MLLRIEHLVYSTGPLLENGIPNFLHTLSTWRAEQFRMKSMKGSRKGPFCRDPPVLESAVSGSKGRRFHLRQVKYVPFDHNNPCLIYPGAINCHL